MATAAAVCVEARRAYCVLAYENAAASSLRFSLLLSHTHALLSGFRISPLPHSLVHSRAPCAFHLNFCERIRTSRHGPVTKKRYCHITHDVPGCAPHTHTRPGSNHPLPNLATIDLSLTSCACVRVSRTQTRELARNLHFLSSSSRGVTISRSHARGAFRACFHSVGRAFCLSGNYPVARGFFPVSCSPHRTP